ncbi:little elongation complex subunit 2 [Notolabrus celidotus]|uniref:little elongation complex subunit 2 n=1 Tax=Notolabrus celidotus TaxID=1203425 RepID=UPI00148F5123|nr:little elongation complex subunit 2 [Notolabrus celidotus]
MELVWEDPPVAEAPFFTRDLYEKYSLAPNIRELWASLQSPVENANTKQRAVISAEKRFRSSSKEEAGEFKDNSSVSKEESCLDRSDGKDMCVDDGSESTEESKDRNSKVTLKQAENEVDNAYPDPRLPYPCLSSLSSNQQKTYLDCLLNKKGMAPTQSLQARVNTEVMEFTRYLQDVARICADDYHVIPEGAMQYSQDFFRDCLECIKTYPQLYQIHEMTSLTGGTFNPGLKLTFEKQLLIMGNVDITDHTIVSADAQLARDYQSVSSENPPAKKAKDMHATVSSDSNAKALGDRYEPHVCLTRDALVRLLDNHGPDFGEQWELPVWVECNKRKGSVQEKTVYIDSPLLKTEMTVRERSHFFHEESLKLAFNKNGSKNVFHLMTELPVSEQQLSAVNSKRDLVSFENCLDFDMDLTDLETFGETTPGKTPKMQKKQTDQDASVKSKQASILSPSSKNERSAELASVNTSNSTQEEENTSLADKDDPTTEETAQPVLREVPGPKTESMREDSAQESDENPVLAEDSDDEKLVIDDSLSSAVSPATPTKSKTSQISNVPEPVPANSESPQKGGRMTRQSTKAKVSGDQLGEILRMQTAMFNKANDTAKHSTTSQETNSPTRCMGTPVHTHPTSLVKPCVTSYLERSKNQDGATCAASKDSSPEINVTATGHKKLLSDDLQAGVEDEKDYEPPEKGSLLYKLYSLQDLLLMVRSSVPLTHSRKVGNNQNKFVPVHVLPKLEYQLCYGVECLTSSEACQLWTETELHSSTVSYIAHINAFTSKVALLRKLPDAWKQNISCGFKPAKSLNILHHLLKKLTGLKEGQYLMAHEAGKPFVTVLKVAPKKMSLGAYNLQQVHSDVPQPPSSRAQATGLVPWIPVDPSVVLPFHKKHSHVPCTFPLTPILKPAKRHSNSHGAGQSNNNNSTTGGKKKKKQKNRAARHNNYMKKLIQKSV